MFFFIHKTLFKFNFFPSQFHLLLRRSVKEIDGNSVWNWLEYFTYRKPMYIFKYSVNVLNYSNFTFIFFKSMIQMAPRVLPVGRMEITSCMRTQHPEIYQTTINSLPVVLTKWRRLLKTNVGLLRGVL